MCPYTGAAQVTLPGAFSTAGGTGAKYSSIWILDGTPGALDSPAGVNWMSDSLPYLSKCGSDEIAVVFDLCTASWFTPSGGGYTPRFGAKQTLTFDSVRCRFVFADRDGTVWEFTNTGLFDRVSYRGIRGTEVTERDSGGRPLKIARPTTRDCQCETDVVSPGRPVTDTNVFEYGTGPEAARIKRITFRRSINPTAGIRRMVYSYYGPGEEHGSAGDLKTATEQLLVGTVWTDKDTSYYRYYKAGEAGGFEHGLKYALGAEAFERLKGDPQVADPFLATDAQVARYADHFYEYNADHQVTKSVVDAGLHTFTFAYTTSAHGDDYNHWKLKVTETRPDGSTEATFSNFIGEAMLTDLASGADHWLEYHRFDADARETLHARPSAVISYDDTQADLGVVLRTAAGLIHLTDYYATTTATPTTPGGAAGYVQFQKVQQGTGGTPIKTAETKYIQRVTAATTIYPVAESTAFRNDDGTGAITTAAAYTWFGTTAQVAQRTTTLPVVPIGQNGTGSTDTITEIFDEDGNLVWRRDARGFIAFMAYDLPTGAMVREIRDVDGAKLTLPSGWTTPPGGGLHLVTDYEHDALGRTTQTLGPPHDIDGQTVRTANWTVYRDLEDETRSGHGFAVGSAGEYEYTLVNPVSIEWRSTDGRTRNSVVAVRRCAADEVCPCAVPGAGTVESAGRLGAADCFPQSSWVRWTQILSGDQSQVTSTRVYHLIPSEHVGARGVNYDETRFGYDRMGRQNKAVSPAGTIARTVFDVRGLAVSNWVGTDDAGATDGDPAGGGAAGNNMVQVSAGEYDGGNAGGDGNLTEQTQFVDASTARVTTFGYDFRDRRTTTDGEIDFYEETVYDNLNQVVRVDRRDTSAGGNLVARSETRVDDRRRVYQTIRYAVNPTTGTVGVGLADNTFYDPVGNVIRNHPAGSEAFTTLTYDGVNRLVVSYFGCSGTSSSSTSSSSSGGSPVAGDVIFEQTELAYDTAGNLIFATRRQRFHDAAGVGPLQGPAGLQPKSRDSYVIKWYDGIGRFAAAADYGTNDNVGPPERPAVAPEPTDLVLVNHTRYNNRGEAFETVDPAGAVNRTDADHTGRTVRAIQNFVAGDDCFCPGAEENVVTEMRYDLNRLVALVAKNRVTGDQVTRYEYGVTRANSELASNDLKRAEIYPSAADSADRVSYAYNRQGETKRTTDRNGTVRDYEFDLLGRLVGDAATTLGAGVDGAVRRIGCNFDVRGLLESATSFADSTGTTVVNEVKNAYNDFMQLVTQYQEHSGGVNTSTTSKVEYGYADGTANTTRPTNLTYTDGTVLDYLYDDTYADKLSRVRTLRWDGAEACRYAYLGLATFVTTDYLVPQVRLDYARGTGLNPYTGLDRFGRIVDLPWVRYSSSSSSSSLSSGGSGNDLVHLKYGYDRSSNRTYRRDEVASSYGKPFDELYEYDRLNQLSKFHRGLLSNENSTITSPTLQQGWQLDATGNWKNFSQFDSTNSARNLDQHRLHNRVNEITQISRTVGPSWSTPEYDRNGNTVVNVSGQQLVFDAWNRLVIVKSGLATLKTYRHDGLNRRVSEAGDGTTVDLYYSNKWQVLTEKIAGSTTKRYVWSSVYVDAMVLRDRDTDSDGALDERLWVQQDANWNTIALADNNGNVVERYTYDPYGAAVAWNVAWVAIEGEASDVDWVYLHQGARFDTKSDLYNFRNREYSPKMGRWLSFDPLGFYAGDSNLYRLTYNNPLALLDPFGLQPMPPALPPVVPPAFAGTACTIKLTRFLEEEHAEWFAAVSHMVDAKQPVKNAGIINKAKESIQGFFKKAKTVVQGAEEAFAEGLLAAFSELTDKEFKITASSESASYDGKDALGRPCKLRCCRLKALKEVVPVGGDVRIAVNVPKIGPVPGGAYNVTVTGKIGEEHIEHKCPDFGSDDFANFGIQFEVSFSLGIVTTTIKLASAKRQFMISCGKAGKPCGSGPADPG